jgi:hypothetical protein
MSKFLAVLLLLALTVAAGLIINWYITGAIEAALGVL